MNRSALIEKVALSLFVEEHCDRRQALEPFDNWMGRLSDRDRDEYRALGTAALDAILPQVSTVEELEALPPDMVAVSNHGTSWTRVAPRGWPLQWYGVTRGYCTSEVALADGPLTVVWTPEVDHG